MFDEDVYVQKAVIRWGLRGWIALQLVSAHLAWVAGQQWRQYLKSFLAEDKQNFSGTAGLYYFAQAASEAVILAAAVASLIWLHRAWSRATPRLPQPEVSPRGVVGWSLIPVWGFWRLLGFLTDLAIANNQRPEVLGVGRWWSACAVFFVSGAVVKSDHLPGLFHVGFGLLGCVVGLLSLRLFNHLHEGVIAAESKP